jgi:hypothetical protein
LFNITVNPPVPVRLTLMDPVAFPIQLNAVVNPGLTYDFQASTNLIQWESLLQFEAGSSPASLTDPASPTPALRFYRIEVVR